MQHRGQLPCAPRWTTHKQLLQDGHKNLLKEEESCVLGIGTEPAFANGNRALLIQTGALKGLTASSAKQYSGHSSPCPHSISMQQITCCCTAKPHQCHACSGRAACQR